MSVVIVIPAYNAAAHIGGVLQRIAQLGLGELRHVVIVNDGSTDATAQSIRQARFTRCPLTVIDRPQNGGYGAAMKDGLQAARAHEPELVACVHADGQYSPEVLPDLCGTLRARALDLLQGSRIASGTALAGGMPLYKYLANAALNQIENRTLHLNMTDYHSGYLIYGRRALRLPFRALSNSFDFDLEVIASARARQLAVGEAPIPTHYGTEVSHLNPISYGLRVLRVMWNFRRGRYAGT
ncbi:MAG: glycosyltransferase family 2 protein [Pseudomonadota bacterium]